MLKSSEQPGPRLLSLTAEHALRALLYLARQDRTNVAAGEIAEAIGAPANYLSKTLQVLARQGIVSGVRGPSGGFRLMRAPEAISVAEIAVLFSEAPRSRMCLLGGAACSPTRSCAAHERWHELNHAVTRMLEEVTLASLVGDALEMEALTSSTTEGNWS